MAKAKTKNDEGIQTKSKIKTVYVYFNEHGLPVHKTKEIFAKSHKIITYPFSKNKLPFRLSKKPPTKITRLLFKNLNPRQHQRFRWIWVHYNNLFLFSASHF